MENKDEYDDEITVYTACQGCAHDGEGAGICSVPGPCQAYPNAEAIEPAPVEELAPEVAAPVKIFPAAGIDNARLFA